MGATFPTDVQEFDSDDRISFSKLDNKFIAVHDDGTEYEFDADTKLWNPIDEDASHDLEADAYGGGQTAGSHAETAATSKKRKNGSQEGSEEPDSSRPKRSNKKQKQPPQPRQNTAVYVTGLPTDATIDEVHDLFSRKGGVIAEEIDSGAPRIKLYMDAQGNFKGDALIVFFKPQSVEMAIMLLDDTDFRVTANGTRDGRIRVQAADSSYKKTQYDQDNAAGDGEKKKEIQQQQQQPQQQNNANGNSGQHQERRPQHRERDRQKIIKKTQKLDAKLADWDDDDPYQAQAAAASRWNKMVILSHMFTLEELEEDPAALLEIKEDIRDECAKLGTVTNVVLFDLEPEGIVSVKFKESESAEACIRMMHGRAFDGRVVEAFLASGKEKFKKSNDKDGGDLDDED